MIDEIVTGDKPSEPPHEPAPAPDAPAPMLPVTPDATAPAPVPAPGMAPPALPLRKRVPGPRRKGGIMRFMARMLTLLLLLAVGLGGLGLYGRVALEQPGPLAKPAAITVVRGMRATDIAEELQGVGAIANGWLFIAGAYVTGKARQFKAGDYEIPAGASVAAIMDIIASGRVLVFKLSVPEGWTTAQVLERITATPELTGDVAALPAEGALLPDTYVFRKGATRDSIIAEMRQAQERLLDDLWARRSPRTPVKSRQEAVILASIVEKETGIAEERPRIAAVFANRLAKGMRLQSDPTVIYGITGGREKLERALTRKDLATETAYNTYRIDGLPPGPIANPGRDSIAAVLNPAETNDLFFVADGTGGHVFAASLDEHESNVRAWRDYVKAKKAEEAGATTPSEKAKSVLLKPSADPPPPGADIPAAEVPVERAVPLPIPRPARQR